MLPHITNSTAGRNRMEPVNNNIFEITFTVPAAIQGIVSPDDVVVLTEQVTKISGLGSLNAGPGISDQKFMGSTISYLNNKLEKTSHELKVSFNLNLRNTTDNFIYKILRAWNQLGYNLNDGSTALKNDYVAEYMKVKIANRAQDVYREIIFKDVMMTGGFEYQGELDYTNNDLTPLEVTFVSDWAIETNA